MENNNNNNNNNNDCARRRGKKKEKVNKIQFLDDKDKNEPTVRGTTEINCQILKAFTTKNVEVA